MNDTAMDDNQLKRGQDTYVGRSTVSKAPRHKSEVLGRFLISDEMADSIDHLLRKLIHPSSLCRH